MSGFFTQFLFAFFVFFSLKKECEIHGNVLESPEYDYDRRRFQQPPPRPPPGGPDPFRPGGPGPINQGIRIACEVGEVRCDVNYCFDETCANIIIESSKNGRCKCAAGLIRALKTRQCVRPTDPSCLRERPQPRPPPRPQPRPPPRPQPRPPPRTPLPNPPIVRPPLSPPRRSEKFLNSTGGPLVLLQMYHEQKANHFYTIDPDEVSSASGETPPYVAEGVAGFCVTRRGACGASWALNRFYSKQYSDHFYATDHTLDSNTDYGDYVPEATECYVWPYDP